MGFGQALDVDEGGGIIRVGKDEEGADGGEETFLRRAIHQQVESADGLVVVEGVENRAAWPTERPSIRRFSLQQLPARLT